MAVSARQDHESHRIAIGCRCGRGLTLPDAGVSYENCACGVAWAYDGREVRMLVGDGEGATVVVEWED